MQNFYRAPLSLNRSTDMSSVLAYQCFGLQLWFKHIAQLLICLDKRAVED